MSWLTYSGAVDWVGRHWVDVELHVLEEIPVGYINSSRKSSRQTPEGKPGETLSEARWQSTERAEPNTSSRPIWE